MTAMRVEKLISRRHLVSRERLLRVRLTALIGIFAIAIGVGALIWLPHYEQPVAPDHLACAIAALVLGAAFAACAPGLIKHLGSARPVGVLLYVGVGALVGYLLVVYTMLYGRKVPRWAGEIADGVRNADFGELFGGVGKLLAGLIALLFVVWLLVRQFRGFRWLSSREARKICGRRTAVRA